MDKNRGGEWIDFVFIFLNVSIIKWGKLLVCSRGEIVNLGLFIKDY